jgi:hypothetical protein
VRSAAFAEMRKLYEGGQARVTRSEAENILGELSASGYAWYPRLDDLALRNDDEKKLAGFIFGGLIFGGYAQLAGTDHLMQPKRSRLFLAISLKEQTSREGEEQIFAKLGELVGRPTAEIPYTPTFFPLLLGRSSGPADLLKNALDMRSSAEVRDYRAWLGEALADFDTNGRIPVARAREVSKIASAIQRKVDGFPFPKVEIKVTVADVVAAKPPGIGIDLTAPAKAAWGWLVTQLPGKRHRKLLTRAVVADREYLELDRRVHTVWSGAALDT